jgi:hypothetical protein
MDLLGNGRVKTMGIITASRALRCPREGCLASAGRMTGSGLPFLIQRCLAPPRPTRNTSLTTRLRGDDRSTGRMPVAPWTAAPRTSEHHVPWWRGLPARASTRPWNSGRQQRQVQQQRQPSASPSGTGSGSGTGWRSILPPHHVTETTVGRRYRIEESR